MMTSRRSADDWSVLVGELEDSDETVAAFAKRKGVSPRTLAWWRWRIRRERAVAPVRFVELEVEEEPVRTLRLRLQGGVEVEVGPGFDAQLLRAVVGALC